MSNASALSRLTAPRSILFIGGNEAATALRVTQQLGYEGRIYALHPHRNDLAGVSCLRSLDDVPETPDAAFISIKREATIAMVRQLAKIGVGGVVCHAAGFAELDETGKTLQIELVQAAGNMALMGPNCYGFINALDQVSPWADEHGLPVVNHGIAIVTQSGNIACNFAMMNRHVPVAGLYTLGNQAVTGIAEMLSILAADKRITAIGLHIEGLPDIARFAAAAELAFANRKPVVLLKTGRSEQGARITMSHTNSLSGSDELYDAMCERWAIARVNSVSAFIETLKFLHHGGPPKGNNVVSLSCSGGEAALVSDLAKQHDLHFPAFNDCDKPAIKATLNDYVNVENPLDYHTFIWNDRDKLTATFSAVLNARFDIAMLLIDIPVKPLMDPASWIRTARAWINSTKATGQRTVTVTTLHESIPPDIAARLSTNGIAPMLGLDDALTAFSAAAHIGQAWQQNATRPLLQAPITNTAASQTLTEFHAKQILRDAGLHIPKGRVCAIEDAESTATKLGFPLVMKACSSELAHKSEAGGVALNLQTTDMIRNAAKHMATLSSEILLEEVITGSVCELILGIKRDPQFGLCLVIGAGGILTELLNDSATLLLPTTDIEIETALNRLKVSILLDGYRGKSGDRPAVIDAIGKFADFALTHAHEIEEAEINPLIVLAPGNGVVVADALFRLTDKTA